MGGLWDEGMEGDVGKENGVVTHHRSLPPLSPLYATEERYVNLSKIKTKSLLPEMTRL